MTLAVLLISPLVVAADDEEFSQAQKDHWAWKQPVRPALPAVKDQAWVRNPIDAFVLGRLETAGLHPAPEATREQLLRRVTFDLIGLPPTPEEIDSFVNDPSADAWARVVDRLLASPHYGERWGRHWLDLVRFAESNGYEHDEIRPDAWRYRDYVIRSFNSDKPYDRFIKEQLAGDELDPENSDALVATGFCLLGPDMTDSSDQAQRRLNTLNDMTDTTSLAFLGMTVACARCHDHKFEPIPQADYYRLQAFFAPARFRADVVIAKQAERAAYDAGLKEYTSLTQPTRDAIARLEEPHRKQLFEAKLARLSPEAQAAHRTLEKERSGGQKEIVDETARLLVVSGAEIARRLSPAEKTQLKELGEQLHRFDSKKPRPLPTALAVHETGGPPPKTFLLERGERSNAGAALEPGFPVILSPGHRTAPARVETARPQTTGRRTTLANWIASSANPLTARVLVNRLWQHHFGRGLVPTPSDFGVRGERPTHPELLDWLALEFVQNGWSVKHMHRVLLLSATYQQSTKRPAEVLAKDPENQLFSRMNRLRLEGEVIRDGLLAASGRLNRRMAGPGVFPPVAAAALEGLRGGWKVSSNPQDHVRRSVYIFARRNLRFPFLETFDLPDSNLSCPQRERSTAAPQALTLLNAEDVTEAASALALRLEKETPADTDTINRAYRRVLGRQPSATETKRAQAFLQHSPLREFCRALFNVNEFVYLD